MSRFIPTFFLTWQYLISGCVLIVTLAANQAWSNGADIYDRACSACHSLGVAGAPKLGDKETWKARIAKGNKVLYENAIKGFQGEFGTMPPKGGFDHLSDNEVKTAVEYMVSQGQ